MVTHGYNGQKPFYGKKPANGLCPSRHVNHNLHNFVDITLINYLEKNKINKFNVKLKNNNFSVENGYF